MVIRRSHPARHVAKHMPGGHDVQYGELADGVGVVQGQPVRDAGAAVVADQLELPEAELAHEPQLVAGHGPLGIDISCGVRCGLA